MRGVYFVLTMVFVILKLGGVIAWSWWLVFLPLIIQGVLNLIFVFFIVCLFYKINEKTGKPYRTILDEYIKKEWRK